MICVLRCADRLTKKAAYDESMKNGQNFRTRRTHTHRGPDHYDNNGIKEFRPISDRSSSDFGRRLRPSRFTSHFLNLREWIRIPVPAAYSVYKRKDFVSVYAIHIPLYNYTLFSGVCQFLSGKFSVKNAVPIC